PPDRRVFPWHRSPTISFAISSVSQKDSALHRAARTGRPSSILPRADGDAKGGRTGTGAARSGLSRYGGGRCIMEPERTGDRAVPGGWRRSLPAGKNGQARRWTMDAEQAVERARRWVAESGNIVFFGGAGTSTDSGIPDFRSADGLYGETGTEVPPEVILSHDFFMARTADFFAYYRAKLLHPDARPNAGHLALVKLEREGRLKGIITQNIDGLHQKAGSRRVLELHGSVHRNFCMKCGAFYGLEAILDAPETVPVCAACGGVIKPDVVLYQEP